MSVHLKNVHSGCSHAVLRRFAQRGAATITMVLLIGVGLISVSVGTMHLVRSTQERQLAAGAQVNAQAGVWGTLEAVRVYLSSLTQEQLNTLGLNQVWTINGVDNLTQQAVITNLVPPISPSPAYRISARLTATDTAARSSSSLEVVYEVVPASVANNLALSGVLDFYNDLNLGGDINLHVPEGGANFNVDGNFTAGGVSIGGEGLARVAVTGDVSISSNVEAEELWGRNITVSGGATAAHLYAFGTPTAEGGTGTIGSLGKGDTCCGNVTTSGGVTGIHTINANGDVRSGGSGAGVAAQFINSRGAVALVSGGSQHGAIVARSTVTAIQGTAVNSLSTQGDVMLGGNSVEQVIAGGSVSCTAGWKVFPSIKAGGAVTGCNISSGIAQLLSPPPTVSVIEKLPPVVLSRPTIDAWALRGSANYALEFEGSKAKVTVNNIQGLANGTYYLGTYNNNPREYLCNVVDDSNKCTLPLERINARPFCNSYSASENNGCFTYDLGAQKWTIAGKSLPPGVVWFKGDLMLSNGIYYNTFIVTGNISTGGQLVTYALNYANYGPICNNAYVESVRAADFQGMKPSNFCMENSTFKYSALGNIGLLAGGYDPADTRNALEKTTYSGGLIQLGAGNSIYGTVLSGDLLKTSGSTSIYGYISAAGLQLSDQTNTLGGSTTVDLNNLPEGYKPDDIPTMEGVNSGGAGTASVLWTRYL